MREVSPPRRRLTPLKQRRVRRVRPGSGGGGAIAVSVMGIG